MNTPPSTTAGRQRIDSKTVAPAIVTDAVDDFDTVDDLIAEQRGFAPGHELVDWRAAEEAINATLLTSQQRG